MKSVKHRVLVIQGSPRSEDLCAGREGKTQEVASHFTREISKWVEVRYLDLAVRDGRPTVQPCRGCVSTAGGYHCHWPCSCLRKGDPEVPDLLYEEGAYESLEWCDAFAVFSPVHWYSVSSQVKAMFDRMVCASLTLTREQAEVIFGKGKIKDPELTRPACVEGKYDRLVRNHLEGRVAAFYLHGDAGAADYVVRPHPGTLDPKAERTYSRGNREAAMPLVWQCRYSGIDAPDDLVVTTELTVGLDYATEDDSLKYTHAFALADELARRLRKKLG